MRAKDDTDRDEDNGNSVPDIEEVLRVLRSLAVIGTTPETALVTMTVAALLPVVQATMSFTLASANSYRVAAADYATVAATAPAVLAQSINTILREPDRAVRAVTRTVVREEPQQLAVT